MHTHTAPTNTFSARGVICSVIGVATVALQLCRPTWGLAWTHSSFTPAVSLFSIPPLLTLSVSHSHFGSVWILSPQLSVYPPPAIWHLVPETLTNERSHHVQSLLDIGDLWIARDNSETSSLPHTHTQSLC